MSRSRLRFDWGTFGRSVSRFVLLPAMLGAVGIVAYFTFRTTSQIDKLRQQSVLEATLGLAGEKAERLDQQIIDEDNAVVAVVDPARLGDLAERWLPTASRETPTVRAILVLDEQNRVLAYASRATSSWSDEETFRRILTQRMVHDMNFGEPEAELRHLHREYRGDSYLVSYWHRVDAGRKYLIIARHDIGRIVRATLPTLYPEKDPANRVNVVDEEGRIIYGPPLRTGQFTVGVKFPTTLYNWRLQVSPLMSEELANSVQTRRQWELGLVTLSCAVILAGMVTILLTAEKERRVSRLKSDFVANVSHELKTPLALVRMFGEMLQSGRVSSEEKRQEYLDIIVRESERLSALIENVLDFARVERGRGAYDMREGDVGEAVAQAAAVYRYRAEREGVELEVDVEPHLAASVDERAIQLALINLLDNALKYGRGGKRIRISARRRPTQPTIAEIRVVDEGPGVPPEARERIFERFVRGPANDGDPLDRPRGSGIGLALVAHIAESHGGRAYVETGSSAGDASSSAPASIDPTGSAEVGPTPGRAGPGAAFVVTVRVHPPSLESVT
jgi:two-component system phosphate regulon sensor histidine kinase PhoR